MAVQIFGQSFAHISHMPRLIRISGNFLLILRIADDKSVLVGVVCKPLSLRRLGECLGQFTSIGIAGDIHRQSGLMFTAARLCTDLVRSLLPIGSNLGLMDLDLSRIRTIPGHRQDLQPLIGRRLKHLLQM